VTHWDADNSCVPFLNKEIFWWQHYCILLGVSAAESVDPAWAADSGKKPVNREYKVLNKKVTSDAVCRSKAFMRLTLRERRLLGLAPSALISTRLLHFIHEKRPRRRLAAVARTGAWRAYAVPAREMVAPNGTAATLKITLTNL
jgi:hypothetical protein